MVATMHESVYIAGKDPTIQTSDNTADQIKVNWLEANLVTLSS